MSNECMSLPPNPCAGCLWENRKRPQKCSCCKRNAHIKDCYVTVEVDDLVSRGELLAGIQKIKEQFSDTPKKRSFADRGLIPSISTVISGIETAIKFGVPAVDAVEVVRCKDCKYMKDESVGRLCPVSGCRNGLGDYGFCSYGERKDNGENESK